MGQGGAAVVAGSTGGAVGEAQPEGCCLTHTACATVLVSVGGLKHTLLSRAEPTFLGSPSGGSRVSPGAP